MNQNELQQYVHHKNAWQTILGHKTLSVVNAQDRQRIAELLDSDLSPENLTCDGLVRGAALRLKRDYLTRCAEALIRIDPNVKMYEFYTGE